MSASGRLSSVRKEVVDLASSEDEVEMLQAASDTQASAARDPIQIVHSVGLLVEALEEVEEVEAVEDVWLHVEAEDVWLHVVDLLLLLLLLSLLVVNEHW